MRQLQTLELKMASLQQELASQVSGSHQSVALAKLALESELRVQDQLKEDTKSIETFNRLLYMLVALWIFVFVLLVGWWTKLNRKPF